MMGVLMVLEALIISLILRKPEREVTLKFSSFVIKYLWC